MWDGIIIGGGLAGLIAGIRASEKGKKILIISQGTGSLTYSSGVLDFGDIEILTRKENHPYALLGPAIAKQGVKYFQTLFPDYIGEWGKHQQVLTPLGTLRRAGIFPKGFSTEALQKARRIVLMVPDGMKDFFPEVVKDNLERTYPRRFVEIYPFQVKKFEPWYRIGKMIQGIDYARHWQSDTGTADFKDLLQQAVKARRLSENEQAVFVFPGLTAGFSASLKNVLDQSPFPVIEMSAFPPSAAGQILYEKLKRKFLDSGGELLEGKSVERAQLKGTLCQKVIVASKGKTVEFSARSFVLATGGILGGGIEVTPELKRETVFKLPLFVPSEWTCPDFLREQPYAKIGIEVDAELRPIMSSGRNVILENVRVVGRMLAHWDPWTEHCGGGVSLASGWLAGEKI